MRRDEKEPPRMVFITSTAA
jgi:hypothetical protein